MKHGTDNPKGAEDFEAMATRLLDGLERARLKVAGEYCPACLYGVMTSMMLQDIVRSHGPARIKEMLDLIIAFGESQRTPQHTKH